MAGNGKRERKKRCVIMVEEDGGARLGLKLSSQMDKVRRGWGGELLLMCKAHVGEWDISR